MSATRPRCPDPHAFGLPVRTVDATRVLRIRQVDAVRVEEAIEDPSVLRRLDGDVSRVHAVILGSRPGAQLFVTLLEHEHFSPITDRERLLETRAVSWMGLHWMMLTVPFADWRTFHDVAGRSGLRVVDGVPTAVEVDAVSSWPMRSSRVCCLENLQTPPNDPVRLRALLEAEDAECEAIREATRRRYREEIQGRN